jgi:hypothetical protein
MSFLRPTYLLAIFLPKPYERASTHIIQRTAVIFNSLYLFDEQYYGCCWGRVSIAKYCKSWLQFISKQYFPYVIHNQYRCRVKKSVRVVRVEWDDEFVAAVSILRNQCKWDNVRERQKRFAFSKTRSSTKKILTYQSIQSSNTHGDSWYEKKLWFIVSYQADGSFIQRNPRNSSRAGRIFYRP